MHNPEPVYPFDAIMTENWAVAVNQLTTRVWQIPPSLGIDHRVVNGYLYISPNAITDPDVIARAPRFHEARGTLLRELGRDLRRLDREGDRCIERLQAIEFAPLPELEDERVVTEHHGIYAAQHLQRRYAELLASLFEMGSYHFEMLNLGYGAYLTFREFCQPAFPGITDRTIARMVAGIDILLFRPDDEVRSSRGSPSTGARRRRAGERRARGPVAHERRAARG